MSTEKDETKASGSEVSTLTKRELLVTVGTDILFSVLFFFLFICVSLILNLIGKYWDSTLVQLFVLFLLSFATICSLIFALQSTLDFFKRLRTTGNRNLIKKMNGGILL